MNLVVERFDLLSQPIKIFAENLSKDSSCRIQQFCFEGKLYWLKQVEQQCGKLWLIKRRPKHRFQSEIHAILELGTRGIPVSKLVVYGDTYFVVQDTGETIDKWLIKERVSRKQKCLILNEAAKTLATLHAQGLCHGRPALRDMTWDGHSIHFIDLENFRSGHASGKLQVRDLFIFVHGFYRGKVAQNMDEEMVTQAIQSYCNAGGEHNWQLTKKLCKRHLWIYYLLWFFRGVGGTNNDIRPIWYAFRHFIK